MEEQNRLLCQVKRCYFNTSLGECKYNEEAKARSLPARELVISTDGKCAMKTVVTE